MSWREVALRRNPECPVCGDQPTQTALIDYEVFCGVKPAPGEAPAQQPGAAADSVPELDAVELARRLDGDAPPFLLDVREPWEWAVGNLEALGARLIPVGELEGRVEEVPRDRPVVVYCRVGERSLTAARRLLDAGWTEVWNLAGGIQAWARDIDPDVPVA
jgi:adenylyltransferase/sulfurtransferase